MIKNNTAVPVNGTQSLKVYAVMVCQKAVEIFVIVIMCASVGRESNGKRRFK